MFAGACFDDLFKVNRVIRRQQRVVDMQQVEFELPLSSLWDRGLYFYAAVA
ncbi:hypothetical protein Q4539_05805 [Yoonia sp. 1_MG-2023]|nr:hypothetical protein [Yoonia sp. 1_MG-2023]